MRQGNIIWIWNLVEPKPTSASDTSEKEANSFSLFKKKTSFDCLLSVSLHLTTDVSITSYKIVF